MTNQDVFDKTWQRFIVEKAPPALQRFPEEHKLPLCVYRNPENPADENLRCAIGLSMSDEVYAEVVRQGRTTSRIELLLAEEPTIAAAFDGCSPHFLGRLQASHDNTAYETQSYPQEEFTKQFTLRLVNLADKFHLKVPNENTV